MFHVLMARGRSDEGFSLVELLVVTLLLGVIGSVVVTGLVRSMQVSQETQARMQATAELQRTADRVGRELRAACPLTTADPLAASARVHRGGEILEHRFRVAGGALTHEVVRIENDALAAVIQSERTLLPDLATTGTGFTYADAEGLAASSPADVRAVRVLLARGLGADSPPLRLETAINLRNGGSSCD